MKKETNPRDITLNSEGWGIISSQMKDIIDRETTLDNIDNKLPAEEYKQECEKRKLAKKIVVDMLTEVIGVNEISNKLKINYS